MKHIKILTSSSFNIRFKIIIPPSTRSPKLSLSKRISHLWQYVLFTSSSFTLRQ